MQATLEQLWSMENIHICWWDIGSGAPTRDQGNFGIHNIYIYIYMWYTFTYLYGIWIQLCIQYHNLMNIEIYTNILTCICICSHILIYIWNMHGRCHSALPWWLTQK
jgi:hypothetical protein